MSDAGGQAAARYRPITTSLERGRLGDHPHLLDELGRRRQAIHGIEDRDGPFTFRIQISSTWPGPWWVRFRVRRAATP